LLKSQRQMRSFLSSLQSAIFTLGILCSTSLGFSQTISEKIASSRQGDSDPTIDSWIKDVNEQLVSFRSRLESCYEQAAKLSEEDAPDEDYAKLLEQISHFRSQIQRLEIKWRDVSLQESKKDEEGYGLWDQEETTLAQLVMEYGALDYLYVVPPEMSGLKLNMHSNIPIPRESWSDVLEIILAHSGIGVKKLNAYARQLYVLKQDPSTIQHVASSLEDLNWVADHSRLFYVFTPPIEQVKSSFQFFEKFADLKQTFVYQIGPKIAIVSSKEEIQKLVNLYQAVWQGSPGKTARVIPISKMPVKEMERILTAFFAEAIEKNRPPFAKSEQDGLSVFSLTQGNSLVLIGHEEVVERAENIVKETEEQLHDPAEMTIYLYQCRHSNPDDLAKVLDKVYASLLTSATEGQREAELTYSSQGPQFKTPDGYAPVPPLVVSPPRLKSGSYSNIDLEVGNDHFISDPKTGALLMVVRRDVLVKIKDLLRKLDVPKKMVQIEVLLFEKRYQNQTSFGMNLLKLGSKKNGIQWVSDAAPSGPGVLRFLLNGSSSKHFPAYDLAYSFLMTQEDIQLNAAPSVITVNQTPAQISIVEEVSINNGAAPVDTNKGIAFEKSFTRTQYGITIILTPTVHLPDPDQEDEIGEGKGFVTLQTNITFDTPKNNTNKDDRPTVDRRHIENEVRVVDGQTVILGGLRRKATQDSDEKIPFLGEIPGLGKLFGSTKLASSNTEMFFFITPTIVLDPEDELMQIRMEQLKKRPGDIPEFLERLVESRQKERKKFFRQSMQLFFGNNDY
jgi:general secretion pathway protein D